MRIRFDRDEHPFGPEFFEDEFSRGRSDGFQAGKVSELFGVCAIILQWRDDRQSKRDSHFVVDVTAARRDMHDARAFAGNDIGAAA